MKRIDGFDLLTGLFQFKTVLDERRREFVLFQKSSVDAISGIADKTAFEALENHVHLLDHIKAAEFDPLTRIARALGQAVLGALEAYDPRKHFRVYVSVKLRGSMIIRFHQVWDGEEPYYHPDDFTSSREKVFAFENQPAGGDAVESGDETVLSQKYL